MTRGRTKQSKALKQPEEGQAASFAAGAVAEQIAFWRDELPRLGRDFDLKALYSPISLCPICRGSRVYRPEGSTDEVACFCRLQSHFQAKIAHWQDYDLLPEPYRNINREELLALDRAFTPTQRVQFSLLLKAVDGFIRNPRGNQIFIGGVGSHCSMLAAYIAEGLEPLPNIFITLRQLVDLLGVPEDPGAGQFYELVSHIPVLLIDDFSSAYGELDEMAAQRLYDLIDYRQNGELPVVIVSDVELDQLWAIHPALLERLQQDAESYGFDSRQIQRSRPAGRSTGQLSPAIPVRVQCCPWLGLEDGADTMGAFPVLGHYCRRTAMPQPVALGYQARACLSADHVACPVFRVAEGQPIEMLPDDMLRQEAPPARTVQPLQVPPSALLIIVGVVLVVVIGGLMVFSELSQPPIPISTPRPTAARVSTAMASISPSPTMTSAPSIAVPPVTMTPQLPVEVSLSQEAHLRMRPEAGAPAFGLLPAATRLVILGRDIAGDWLYVEVRDDLSGWVEVSGVAESVDVMAIPVYGANTPTVDVTLAGTAVYPSETHLAATPTPGIPDTFKILLQAINISACDYPDLSLDYVFLMSGNRITITRVLDGTVLTGSYSSTTGAFRVSAAHDFGLEDMNGTIRLVDGWLEVRGEQELTYFDGSCDVLWSISGRMSAGGGW